MTREPPIRQPAGTAEVIESVEVAIGDATRASGPEGEEGMNEKREQARPKTTAYLEGQRKLRESWRKRDAEKRRQLLLMARRVTP